MKEVTPGGLLITCLRRKLNRVNAWENGDGD